MTDTATPAPPPAAAPAAPSSPSPYADAQTAIDAANAATLSQLAAGNISGVNAGNTAVQAGQADKAAALQGLLRSAIMTGGPQAAPTTGGGPSQAQALQGIVGGAYDQRIGTTGDLTAAFSQANATREAGAGTYFKEAGAAVPVIQAQTAQRETILKAQAQQRALTGALSLARAQASLSKATSTAPGSALTATGKGALPGSQKAQLAYDLVNQYASQNGATGIPGPKFLDLFPGAGETLAAQLGVDPGTLRLLYEQGASMTNNRAPAAPKATATVTGATATAARDDAVQLLRGATDANGVVHPPVTRQQAIAALDARYGPGVGEVVIGQIPGG